MDNDFPDGWVKTTIGDLASYINGRAFKPSEWGEKGKPIVRIQNLNKENAKYNYTKEDYDHKYFIRNNELLFAWSASLGSYIWRGGDAWLNQHIFKVIPEGGVEKKYLYYLLSKITAELYVKAHGSGMVHVTKSKFEETVVFLPPSKEQKRIVAKIEALFSELDSGIAALKDAREQLKVYCQAVLKHAFDGKLTAQWRKDNADKLESPAHLLARIQQERENRYRQQLEDWDASVNRWDSDGKNGKKPSKPKKLKNLRPLSESFIESSPTLPKNWFWGQLGNLTTGVEYGTSSKSYNDGLVPVVRMGNLQKGKIDWSDLLYCSDDKEIEKYSLKKGDILFNRTNSPELVGKTAKYRGERTAIFAGYLIRINHIESVVMADYLNYFLGSHVAKNHGDSVKTDGVNQSNINGQKLALRR